MVRLIASALVLFALFTFLPSSPSVSSTASAQSTPSLCAFSRSDAAAGPAQYALLVAVEDYPQSPNWKLNGPVTDARDFNRLLRAYDYDGSNICVLENERATLPGVIGAFKALASTAREDDQVTIFFAGHGTQIEDEDGDEFSGQDQALVLYDSEKPLPSGKRLPFLTDDMLASLLATVRAKTSNVTVVVDSCHSGTVSRGDAGVALPGARLAPRLSTGDNAGNYADWQEMLRAAGIAPVSEGESAWSTVAPEDTVVLAAARDGTLAYEANGRGRFTQALFEAVHEQNGRPITLGALERRLRASFAGFDQTPVIHGDASKFFLSAERQAPVFGLSVRDEVASGKTNLVGLRLNSMDVGAEFNIYDGSLPTAEMDDPTKAKASAIVTGVDGPTLEVEVSAFDGAEAVRPGDIAIQVAPSADARKLKVDASGLNDELKGQIAAALSELGPDAALVELVSAPSAYSIRLSDGGQIQIIGPDKRVRNQVLAESEGAIEFISGRLANHARQWSLQQLSGEGGQTFSDNKTLHVRLVAPDEDDLPETSWCDGEFTRRQTARLRNAPDDTQMLPLCSIYAVEVSADIPPSDTTTEISVGAFVFSHDGSIFALGGQQQVILSSTQPRYVFDSDILQAFIERSAFENDLPPDVSETIVVFGVDADSAIPWHLFDTENGARARNARSQDQPVSNPLFEMLDSYVTGGSRTKRIASSSSSQKPWTITKKAITISVNPVDVEALPPGEIGDSSREYSVNDFEISPFIPAGCDENRCRSALGKVLLQADSLARRSDGHRSLDTETDGFPYTQHAWCEGSDEANLERGIDCSRSIWYAFTRAGLAYTPKSQQPLDTASCKAYGSDDYLATADMASPDSPLNVHFDNCMDDRPFRTGDVLVYRDEDRGVGHTVMVIDPAKRIAWGSHGWDGNPLIGKTADTGVEYQHILRKSDWGAWDRSTMSLKACWRHKEFGEPENLLVSWLDRIFCSDPNGCAL